jgi:hypothetical protein
LWQFVSHLNYKQLSAEYWQQQTQYNSKTDNHSCAKPVAKVLLLVICIPSSGVFLIGHIHVSFSKVFVTIFDLG